MATPRTRADCAHLTQGLTTPLPRLWAVLGLTGTFMVIEIVGGWLSGSLALLADAAHMLTDAGALALVPLRLARRPARGPYTLGPKRAKILYAQLKSATLAVLGLIIVAEGAV